MNTTTNNPWSAVGHHQSVLASHNVRRASDSCTYLLSNLQNQLEKHNKSGSTRQFRILDVGCGPGSITIDLAKIVSPYKGVVIGIEPQGSGETALKTARDSAQTQGVTNIIFVTASIYDLDLESLGITDGEGFDLVHAHQVIQHLPDPVGAIKVMKSITRSGGQIALRVADPYTGFHYPLSKPLEKFNESMRKLAEINQASPNAANALIGYCVQAGFTRVSGTGSSKESSMERSEIVQESTSVVEYLSRAKVQWWADMWEMRVLHSGFADDFLKHGLGSREDLEEMANAWKEWGTKWDEGAWCAHLCVEVICRVR